MATSRLTVVLAALLLTLNAQAETPVSAEPVSALVFYPEFSAPAEVISKQDAFLSAQISAQIEKIHAQVGDQVAAGDTLVELDCAIYQAQLNTQRAALGEIDVQLSLASDQYTRAKRLNEAGNLGEEGLQQRATELEALQARRVVQEQQVKVAQISVDRCVVTAPFAGVVTERAAQLGALAAPGSPLMRLVQLADAELSARVPPTQSFSENQLLKFDYLNRDYPAQLRVVLPVVDSRQRTQELRLTFPEQLPPPGAAGRLLWQASQPHLPAELLVRRQQGEAWKLGVMVVVDGTAVFYPAENAIEGQPFATDLPKDSMIITDGRLLVREGEAVSLRGDAL
jgi:RND family efflux transporter MFP subunit